MKKHFAGACKITLQNHPINIISLFGKKVNRKNSKTVENSAAYRRSAKAKKAFAKPFDGLVMSINNSAVLDFFLREVIKQLCLIILFVKSH